MKCQVKGLYILSPLLLSQTCRVLPLVVPPVVLPVVPQVVPELAGLNRVGHFPNPAAGTAFHPGYRELDHIQPDAVEPGLAYLNAAPLLWPRVHQLHEISLRLAEDASVPIHRARASTDLVAPSLDQKSCWDSELKCPLPTDSLLSGQPD